MRERQKKRQGRRKPQGLRRSWMEGGRKERERKGIGEAEGDEEEGNGEEMGKGKREGGGTAKIFSFKV
ncbi:hypothetical protein RF55_22563 [Lasius niger]|uniref:Uncharacterized protein n=1 Tax=Lasius niger TaxID=67767 RepID=A0A0J7JWL6_LASNI|nr:hypothetical protein RF55_22563 [Lasius niger]